MNKRYTKENKEYLRKIADGTTLTNEEVCAKFNKKFNQSRTVGGIMAIKTRLGITQASNSYTEEQIEYMREIAPYETARSMQKKFNKKYNQNRTLSALSDVRGRNGIYLKSDGRFEKGGTPGNTAKIGEEVVKPDGYIKVKIAMPDKWKYKQRLIWEKHHGKIPENHRILFGDGDRSNLDIDNLLCISRKELAELNKGNLIQNSAELTKTMLNIMKLNGYARELSERL